MIVVAGEALVDLVPGQDDALRAHPGGGPFNTARTIGRLGQPVAFLGRLSSDRFGRTLEAMLEADGVGLGSVVRTDEPTTLALAEVDAAGAARYRFYERATSAPGLEPADALAALPPDVGRPARRARSGSTSSRSRRRWRRSSSAWPAPRSSSSTRTCARACSPTPPRSARGSIGCSSARTC